MTESAARLAEIAAAIGRLDPRKTFDMLAIGRALTEAKGLAGHGAFRAWLATLPFKPRSAETYRRAAAVFSDTPDVVSKLSPSLVIALAAAPEDVRAEALAEIRAGETITAKAVVAMAAEARTDIKKAQMARKRRRLIRRQDRSDAEHREVSTEAARRAAKAIKDRLTFSDALRQDLLYSDPEALKAFLLEEPAPPPTVRAAVSEASLTLKRESPSG